MASQGRINRYGARVRKKIVGPTHWIEMKGQMTVFCSIFVVRFQCQFLYTVVLTFQPVCSEMFSLFLLISNFDVMNILAHVWGP